MLWIICFRHLFKLINLIFSSIIIKLIINGQYMIIKRSHVYFIIITMSAYLCFLFFTLINFSLTLQSKAPFIDPDAIHKAHSQFEVNLILNENRNLPIIVITLSIDKTADITDYVVKQAMRLEPGIFFSIVIDCRDFSFDLDRRLGICNNFDKNQLPPQDGTDPWVSIQLLTPSQSRIKQKGHTILKAHDFQFLNLASLDGQTIAKKIRSELPDFIFEIQDSYDLTEFLRLNSTFKSSKIPKLIYFDTNLLSPMFLRKLAVILDRQIDIAICDDSQIANNMGSKFDQLILLQYNFQKDIYQYKKIQLKENPFQDVKNALVAYLQIRRIRDIVLDFQHKDPTMHNVSNIKVIDQLLYHGRMILLQLSSSRTQFKCTQLESYMAQYDTMLNYICLNSSLTKNIFKKIEACEIEIKQPFLIFINSTIKDALLLTHPISNFSNYFLSQDPRVIVSSESDVQLCIRGAQATKKDPIFYYFNEKTGKKAKKIIEYFNSLSEVNSLFYFCRIVSPDSYLIKKFELKQNSIFSLIQTGTQAVQKMENSAIDSFMSIKTIIRQIAIKTMSKSYEDKLLNNQIYEIKNPQQLTAKCFNKNCIIGLIAAGRYREKQQKQMLKRLKLQFEDLGYQFVWIDGICHYEIAKQMKLLKKKEKLIYKSYVFRYKEKDGSYQFWENKKDWDEKSLRKWLKSLKLQRNVKFLKYTLDIEDKICKPTDSQPTQQNQL